MTLSVRLRILFGGLTAAAALLATAPSHADGMPTFNLVIRAGSFVPETMEVPANTKFRLLIKNEGPGAEEFESKELGKEKVLAPGASSFLIFQGLKPGTYKFFGEFHPATAQGRFVAK
jgi:Cupredoxin-like domain